MNYTEKNCILIHRKRYTAKKQSSSPPPSSQWFLHAKRLQGVVKLDSELTCTFKASQLGHGVRYLSEIAPRLSRNVAAVQCHSHFDFEWRPISVGRVYKLGQIKITWGKRLLLQEELNFKLNSLMYKKSQPCKGKTASERKNSRQKTEANMSVWDLLLFHSPAADQQKPFCRNEEEFTLENG